MAVTTNPALCASCGAALPSESSRGPRRKLCRDCATSSTYNARWRAAHPDYIEAANAARRVSHEPIACEGCGLPFVPRRSDTRFCCHYCNELYRVGGRQSPSWIAVHQQGHLEREAVTLPLKTGAPR